MMFQARKLRCSIITLPGQEYTLASVQPVCRVRYDCQSFLEAALNRIAEQDAENQEFADLLAKPSVVCVINGVTSCDSNITSAPAPRLLIRLLLQRRDVRGYLSLWRSTIPFFM